MFLDVQLALLGVCPIYYLLKEEVVSCSTVKTISGQQLHIHSEQQGGRITVCNVNTCAIIATPPLDSCMEGSTIFRISAMLKNKQVADRMREFQLRGDSALDTSTESSAAAADGTDDSTVVPLSPEQLSGDSGGGGSSKTVSWMVFTLVALGLVLLVIIMGTAVLVFRGRAEDREAPEAMERSEASAARRDASGKQGRPPTCRSLKVRCFNQLHSV